MWGGTPQPGVVKINFDGSYVNSFATGVFLLRDWMGKVLKVGAANYGHASSLVAEARALKNGVCLAIQAGHTNIDIEGDSLIVIQALKGKFHIPWQIANIIEDLHSWFQQGIPVTITHIFREANMAADWLSKFAHSLTDKFITDLCFFPFLSQIIADDLIRRTLAKRGVWSSIYLFTSGKKTKKNNIYTAFF